MGHEEIEHLFERLLRCLVEKIKEGESFVATLQFTLTLNISPAPQPFTESATSGSVAGQVGQALNVTSGLDLISGGTAPYSVAVDSSSPNQLPDGVSVSIGADGNLNVTGTPTVAGSGSVVLAISDSGQ